MGGKGASPQNSQMLQFEMQQAEEARQKEEERKARLEKGKKFIDEQFGGKKKTQRTGAAEIDLSGIVGAPQGDKGAVGDTGLEWFRGDPNRAADDLSQPYGLRDIATGTNVEYGPTWEELVGATKGKKYNLLGPTGEIEGGFQDDFYNKFRDASLAYNMPQVTDQYERFKKNLNYDLARAGLLRSTAANEATADAEKQLALNEAAVKAKADQETAGLRSSIASQQQTALNQLYATEDPDIAATTAINMVHNANLQQPQMTPLGDLFKPLVIGAIGAYNAFNDQSAINEGRRTGFTGRQTGSQTTTQS